MALTQASIGMLDTSAASGLPFRNRIINGDMRIDQRNAGASVTSNSGLLYPVDRSFIVKDTATTGVMTAQQSSVAPAGFTNSVKLTTTTAQASLAATDYMRFSQVIEGFNAADLAFGTASAKTVTLSFWVQCSLTGTFGGSLGNSAWNRTYPFTYTISSANTWEYKTIIIPGDTSGTWLTNNGIGLRVDFGLGVGSTYSGTAGSWASALYISATGATNVIGTNASTWYVTGVQLEAGSQASSFERRPYGMEFSLCQRYYQRCWDYGTATGTVVAGPVGGTWQYNQYSFFLGTGDYGINCATPFPTVMRATPTITIYSAANGTAGSVTPWNGSDYSITSNSGFVNSSTTRITGANYNNGTTAGLVYAFYWTASAEI